MYRHCRTVLALPLGLAVITLGACKRSEPPPQSDVATSTPATPTVTPFAVRSIDIGKGLTAGKQVGTPTTTFGPRDTIYVSVMTEGSAPSKTITARWTYQTGQVVKEGSETIAPTGPAATEFHIAKSTAWPAGKYKVEILVDGSSAGVKEFEVKK